MAYICYEPKGSCKTCRHYRWDEEADRMACFASIDKKLEECEPKDDKLHYAVELTVTSKHKLHVKAKNEKEALKEAKNLYVLLGGHLPPFEEEVAWNDVKEEK